MIRWPRNGNKGAQFGQSKNLRFYERRLQRGLLFYMCSGKVRRNKNRKLNMARTGKFRDRRDNALVVHASRQAPNIYHCSTIGKETSTHFSKESKSQTDRCFAAHSNFVFKLMLSLFTSCKSLILYQYTSVIDRSSQKNIRPRKNFAKTL